MDNYLEDEYRDAYTAWKAAPGPDTNRAIVEQLQPVVAKGIQMFGKSDPLARSRARQLTLKSLNTYDPNRARLQSHVLNHLKGLQRQSRQAEFIRAPERVVLESSQLREYEQALRDELGRDPTDVELSDRSGFSPTRIAKVRRYQPGTTVGALEGLGVDTSQLPGESMSPQRNLSLHIVYDELPPTDQKIMEWTLGLHNQRRLSNKQIAQKLGITPAAVSQRKARIQQKLENAESLLPFGI